MFDTPENFNIFINKVKTDILNDLPDILKSLLESGNLHKNHHIMNLCNLSLKDFEFDRKEELLEEIKNIYSN